MKTKFKDFLNESSHYKVNDVFFYKNQYMSEPKKVYVVDVQEYMGGEIESIVVRDENGNRIKLLPYEFKYLSEVEQKKTEYDIVTEVKNQIYNIVGESPKIINDLFDFIKSKKESDNVTIIFTEEVKDGRTPKFNINKPLLLKGRILGVEEFRFQIVNIKYNRMSEQDSDYNEYFDYIYDMKIKII